MIQDAPGGRRCVDLDGVPLASGQAALGRPRSFVDPQEAVLSPTLSREPSLRRGRRRFFGRSELRKAIEPPRRREAIDAAQSHSVLFCVHQHVDDRVAHLAWGPQRMRVIALAPDASTHTEHSVHRSCKAGVQSAHAARERLLVVRFHDEVHVIRLHREMHDAKRAAEDARPPRRIDRVTNGRSDRLFAKRRQSSPRAHGDVNGMARPMRRSHDVRHLRPGARPSTGAGTSATPGAPTER